MKALLVWPGHTNSTFNTAWFYERALRQAGVRVANFSYHNELVYANATIKTIRGTEEDDFGGETMLLASRMGMGYVASADPDLIVVVTALGLYKGFWKWMADFQRRLKKPYKTALILTESPYRPSREIEILTWADYVFTNERTFVGRLRRFQPRTWYLPQAYDPDIHKPGDTENKYGVYFCGSGFNDRIRLLSEVDWRGFGFTLKGLWPEIEGTDLERHLEDGVIPNEEVVEDYRASAIALNIHRQHGERMVFEVDRPDRYAIERRKFEVEGAESMNNRACEIAATGAFQLCDDSRLEVEEVFGDSVPRFSLSDAEELEDLVAYYLPRPEARAKCAVKARMRIEGRTYLANVKTILEKLEE